MMRLRQLDAVGFRGIRLAAPLDFRERCGSMVVFGANGHGKSSYVDALECYFYSRIGHLERENVSRAAYRHRAHPHNDVASVRVELSDAGKAGTLTIDADRHLIFAPDGPEGEVFRDTARQELIILRHRDLSRFVDMTKREKLADLAPLIGVQALEQTRGELQAAVRQLETELTSQGQLIRERQGTVGNLLGIPGYAPDTVWERVNQHLRRLGAEGDVGDSDGVRRALARVNVASDAHRDERAKAVQHAQRAIDGVRQLPDVSDSVGRFLAAFNHLASDEQALQDLALAGLWETGLEVLRSRWWQENRCPLCRQAVVDRHELSRQLDNGLTTAAAIRERRGEMEALRDRAREHLQAGRNAIWTAMSASEGLGGCSPFLAAARDAAGVLDELLAALGAPFDAGRTLGTETVRTWDGARSKLQESAEMALGNLSVAVSGLAMSEEERLRLEAYRTLSAVESELTRLGALAQERDVIETQTRSLRNVLRAFEEHERAAISHILEQISGNVSRYYQRLHGGERYANVRLEFLPEDRGLEFSLEVYGEQISPPRLVLSESHMSSLGLCLFLAAAREFNAETRFIILDDIVNSFDADHRAQLANLLIEEFQDFQVIAFTHDPIWFEMLRRMAPSWEVRRIVGWSYELGVQMELPLAEERDRIEQALGNGNEETAGNLLRQYAERQLKMLCRELRVLLPYREGYENERRTTDELFRHVRRHARQRNQFAGKDHPVWQQFGASAFIANLASHDQPALPVPLSTGDIRFALGKLEELVDLFRCEQCKKWVWLLREHPSGDESQCECGNLRFR